LVERKRQHHHF